MLTQGGATAETPELSDHEMINLAYPSAMTWRGASCDSNQHNTRSDCTGGTFIHFLIRGKPTQCTRSGRSAR
eukprot:9063241-Pyramimonas_sp.AAC.1